MKILHLSDTHSLFPNLKGNFNVVIHSGDFFPNSEAMFNNNKSRERYFQESWLRDNIQLIKEWLYNKPFLFTLGNHDFIDPKLMENILQDNGIEAISLQNKITTFNGLNFYGFPYVPTINGLYEYESDLQTMSGRVDELVRVLNSTYIDVVVAHGQLYGTLDQSGFGSTILDNGFNYSVSKDMMPQAYLGGHLHKDFGITMKYGMLIVNSATVQHIIEIN